MTCCIAAICDNGKTLVMAADKMVGMGYVKSEPDIVKMRPIHDNWWMQFAGDNISPVFDIVDNTKRALENAGSTGKPADIQQVIKAVEVAFEEKRSRDAATLFLPTGWTLERFNTVGTTIPDFEKIRANLDSHSLHIELLVSGFHLGMAYVFQLIGDGPSRGVATRMDIPGFWAIGSGGTVATFFMHYREMSPSMTTREAVFYAFEAKYYGEQADGVGERSDLYVARKGKELISISDEAVVEKKLVPVCYRLSPAMLDKKGRAVINDLPGLGEFPMINERSGPSRRTVKQLAMINPHTP